MKNHHAALTGGLLRTAALGVAPPGIASAHDPGLSSSEVKLETARLTARLTLAVSSVLLVGAGGYWFLERTVLARAARRPATTR